MRHNPERRKSEARRKAEKGCEGYDGMPGETAGPVIGDTGWPRRLVFWASIAAIVFLCFWYIFEIVLLAFAGALLAIILHACADWLEKHSPKRVGPTLSYTTIVLVLVLLACLVGYLIIPSAVSEASQIARIVPKSFAHLTAYFNQKDWGKYVVNAAQNLIGGSTLGAKVSAITSGIGTAIEGAIVILVVGLYGALYARGYSQGMLELIPERHRARAARVSGAVVYTLRWWLIGQLVPMIILGVATMVGLWLLGVPLAFALGLLTGIMIFIPYVGSWIAFVPTVMVSLTQGTNTAIYVAVFYLAVHAAEGYILTPMIQKRAVLLPPVLTILAQLFMWRVAGLLGVALATPIAAAGLVLVKSLYLHERVES